MNPAAPVTTQRMESPPVGDCITLRKAPATPTGEPTTPWTAGRPRGSIGWSPGSGGVAMSRAASRLLAAVGFAVLFAGPAAADEPKPVDLSKLRGAVKAS